MKKVILSLLLVLLLCFSAACTSVEENTTSADTRAFVTESVTELPTEPPNEEPTEKPTQRPTEKPTKAPSPSSVYSYDSSPDYTYEASSSSVELPENSMTVYITPTGKRWHLISTCGGKNSYPVSINNVGGRTPCKKCAS